MCVVIGGRGYSVRRYPIARRQREQAPLNPPRLLQSFFLTFFQTNNLCIITLFKTNKMYPFTLYQTKIRRKSTTNFLNLQGFVQKN